MNPFEPALPPIPLTTASAVDETPAARSLRLLRHGSHYKKARGAIALGLILETIAGVSVLLFAVVAKRGPSPLIVTGWFVGVMIVSFIGAEVATAVFDVADATLHDRIRQTDLHQV